MGRNIKVLRPEFFNTYRFIQLLPCNVQRKICFCLQEPFHQGDAAVLDFNAGDTAWMDAASGIEIRRLRISSHGAVGMSCDKQFLLLRCPCGEAHFSLLFFGIITGGTGGV